MACLPDMRPKHRLIYIPSRQRLQHIRKRRSDETLRENERDIQLLAAAANGHTARVNYLLRLGADVDHSDNRGLTALHHAAYSGWEDTVEALHTVGANSEAQAELWGTPLHLAAVKGRANVVRLLLRYRAVVNSRSRLLGTPLHCACLAGDPNCATALLHEGADAEIIAQTFVIRHSDGAATQWSLEDVDSSEGQMYGSTPASLAIVARSILLVQLLTTTNSRANATARRQRWDAPIFNWSDERGKDVVTLLMLAASLGCTEICCDLISRGADVNGEGSNERYSFTALLEASLHGHTDTCLALLARGAKPACRDNWSSALIEAVKVGHTECSRALLEDGVNVDAVSNQGYTALMIAVSANQESCLQLLLEHNASTAIVDEHGYTAMRHAVRWQHRNIMDLLISHDPSCLDRPRMSAETLLHTAVDNFLYPNLREGTLKTVKHLVQHGVDPLAKNNQGLTPLASFIRRNEVDDSDEYLAMYNYLHDVTHRAKKAKP